MTDRELLEFAAKAAGMDGWEWDEEMQCIGRWKQDDLFGRLWQSWIPLEGDGDALRLAGTLKLSVTQMPAEDGDGPCIFVTDEKSRDLAWEEIEEESERQSAIRRAIVRAAAEIQLQKERDEKGI